MSLLEISHIKLTVEETTPSRRVLHLIIRNLETGQSTSEQLSYPTSSIIEDEIAWYLEDYVVQDCFETTRAEKAAKTLQTLMDTLARGIHWHNVIPSFEAGQWLDIRVDQGSMEAKVHIFWESLEEVKLWPEDIRPSGVRVSRSLKAVEEITKDSTILGERHVLVCTARPNSDQDIPHRLVTRHIVNVATHSGTHIEIVRPGTFSAFEERLMAHEPGYFDLVHFDLHGFDDGSGR